MTIEQTMDRLREVLEEIDKEDLRKYVSEIDEDDRNKFVIDFMYGKKEGADKGLIPVTEAILESFPIDRIPKEQLRSRVSETGIEKRIEGCNSNIKDIKEELKVLEKKKTELIRLEEEIKKLEDEKRTLETQINSLKDNERKISELEGIVEELKKNPAIPDKNADFKAGSLFENKAELENYEKFLSACLKGSKMIDPTCRDGTMESADARIVHRFMLIKWYLNSSVEDGSVVFEDDAFKQKYEEIMKKFDALSEEGKEFFKNYMDHTELKTTYM